MIFKKILWFILRFLIEPKIRTTDNHCTEFLDYYYYYYYYYYLFLDHSLQNQTNSLPLTNDKVVLLQWRPLCNSTTSPPPSLRSTRHHICRHVSILSHHPSLEVLGGAADAFLPALKTLHHPYQTYPFIGWNRHLETIFSAFFRKLPEVRLKRECLRTLDDGSVALDWVSGDEGRLPADSPLLVLLPGLTGGSEDTYVRHMMIRARNKGWRVVVFNSRGCADSPVTTPQFYSASFTGDMREVIRHVSTRYPKANIYAVGWSLGANILVRYLGEESQSCPLSGAVSLCNPFDLVIADEDFRMGFNNVYDRALASGLREIFKRHRLLFEDMGGEYNIPLAAKARTVKDFDEALTRVSFGFKSADDYYSHSSSSDSIRNVCTPLLCIQAANDPIAPSRGIPRDDIKENPNCMLVVTPQGGHLGWVAGDEAPLGAPWTDPLVVDFLEHLRKGQPEPEPHPSSSINEPQHNPSDNLKCLDV